MTLLLRYGHSKFFNWRLAAILDLI